jgi:ParB family chromosome partitioning protein
MVQALKNGEDVQTARKRITTRVPLSSSLNESKNRLTSMLNTKVQLTCSPKGSGKISIAFANEEDLNRIMSLLER